MRYPASRPGTLATMRPVLAAFTCALLLGALGLSACGGDDRAYDAVPANTPELIPPDDANDLASGAAAGKQSSGTTGAQGTTPSTGGTTTPAPSTGGTAPTPTPAPAPTPTPDTGGGTAPDTGGAAPNTGGASPDDSAAAGSVQQFCADNPGAC